jgi:hypothetical protein
MFNLEIETLINFIKNTKTENITAVTIVVELLSKRCMDKEDIKRIVESSIRSLTYCIDEKKKDKLLELNLKVTIILFVSFSC